MKPVAWRIFRNNRWTYSESRSDRQDERTLWQPLYTDMDIQAEREACARVCEEPIDLIQITDDCSEYVYKDHLDCAEAIRARREQ